MAEEEEGGEVRGGSGEAGVGVIVAEAGADLGESTDSGTAATASRLKEREREALEGEEAGTADGGGEGRTEEGKEEADSWDCLSCGGGSSPKALLMTGGGRGRRKGREGEGGRGGEWEVEGGEPRRQSNE